MLFSGMSTIVVTPPAAAARVADVKLPLGAARVVHMHVRVDQAGHQHLVVGQLDVLGTDQVSVERLDRDDPAVLDADLAFHSPAVLTTRLARITRS